MNNRQGRRGRGREKGEVENEVGRTEQQQSFSI